MAATKTKEATLTIGQGKRAARFRKLTADGMARVRALLTGEEIRLLAEFPSLKAIRDNAAPPNGTVPVKTAAEINRDFVEHPDYERYSALLERRCDFFPWLAGAWDGDDGPLTQDDLAASDDEELIRCGHEVMRLNPYRRQQMPLVWQQTYREERADPN